MLGSGAERAPSGDPGLKGKARQVFQRRCLEKSLLNRLVLMGVYHKRERGRGFLPLSRRMILIGNNLAELDVGISKSVIPPEGKEIVIRSLAVGRNRIVFCHITGC
jgi:hypothetical protein